MFKSKDLLGNFLVFIDLVIISSTVSFELVDPPGGGCSMAGWVYSTRKQRIKRSDRAGRQYKKKNKTQQGVGTQLLELFKHCFAKEQLAFNPRRNYFHLYNLNQTSQI
uniref:Uncharacterized protein n=1 Tax=Cacopsylla melanoneura TaxID=428564 RepID=A0A8D8QFI2_9HEMI